ncbi:MAG: formylmethanofuran dehydrogenase subunit E family protein [Candidatus Bathyarchaeota archaeon]|nr:formylmethanofuran dehydrogenase subunit E family protein [Candidatus Bathyarchaeota archaeon]
MNFVKELKPRKLTPELEKRAIEFHGHDGPFMTIGLRMGITALEILDCKGWFGLNCEVRLNWAPPDSCVIDGIQSSTGCTMGKKNITVVEQPGVEAVFTSRDKKSVQIKLKQEVIDRLKGGMTEDDIPHSMIEAIEEAPLDEIFEIQLS